MRKNKEKGFALILSIIFFGLYNNWKTKILGVQYNLFWKICNQKKQVLSIIKDLDISLIDIEAEILLKKIEYLKIFPFGMYGHYNIDGYRIISNIIYDKIIN